MDELKNIAEALRTYGNNEDDLSRNLANNTNNVTFSYDYNEKQTEWSLDSKINREVSTAPPANDYAYQRKLTQQRLDSGIDGERKAAASNVYIYPNQSAKQRLESGSNGERKAASNVYIYPNLSTKQRLESGSNGERKAASNVYIYPNISAKQSLDPEKNEAGNRSLKQEENGKNYVLLLFYFALHVIH